MCLHGGGYGCAGVFCQIVMCLHGFCYCVTGVPTRQDLCEDVGSQDRTVGRLGEGAIISQAHSLHPCHLIPCTRAVSVFVFLSSHSLHSCDLSTSFLILGTDVMVVQDWKGKWYRARAWARAAIVWCSVSLVGVADLGKAESTQPQGRSSEYMTCSIAHLPLLHVHSARLTCCHSAPYPYSKVYLLHGNCGCLYLARCPACVVSMHIKATVLQLHTIFMCRASLSSYVLLSMERLQHSIQRSWYVLYLQRSDMSAVL